MATGITTKTLADYTQKPLSDLKLYEIAGIINRNWRETSKNGVNFAAKPYLEAMSSLNSIADKYILDSGKSIVIYFLCNANTWKGPVAKEIKAHLKKLIA